MAMGNQDKDKKPKAGAMAALAAAQQAGGGQPDSNPLLAAIMKPQSDLGGSGGPMGVAGGIGTDPMGNPIMPGGGPSPYALHGGLGVGGTVFGNVDPFGEVKFP